MSPFQASFILESYIQDNIIIAQEMIHTMRRIRGRKGFFAIKVDREKAYDQFNWCFIQSNLEAIGMDDCFINLIIMICI